MSSIQILDLFGMVQDADIDALLECSKKRNAGGFNCLAIFRAEKPSEVVTLYLKDRCAVLVYTPDDDSEILMLKGNRSVDEGEVISFKSRGGFDDFTGLTITNPSIAIDFTEAFMMGYPWPGSSEWIALSDLL